MKILFEDNHLLIIDKPAGMTTQVSPEHKQALETEAKRYLKKKYQKQGDVFLGVVHRLDKEVAGIVVFAKTSKALSRMNEMIRGKTMVKIYHARVHGHLEIKEQKLCDFLVKRPHHAGISFKEDPEAKECVLYYKVLKEEGENSLLEIQLESGRYHQIRVQLSHLGHPVLGDTKYGSMTIYPDSHIDLKHVRVEFAHPIQKTLIEIVAE